MTSMTTAVGFVTGGVTMARPTTPPGWCATVDIGCRGSGVPVGDQLRDRPPPRSSWVGGPSRPRRLKVATKI